MSFAELAVTTNFSFLRGASSPEELAAQAKQLDLAAIGIADRNSVAGVVRAHVIATQLEVRLLAGARLVFADGTPDIVAYPHDRAAWGRLTQILSVGKSRGDKAGCILYGEDLMEYLRGLNLIVMPPPLPKAAVLAPLLIRLRQSAPHCVWLGATMLYRGDDRRRLARLSEIARQAAVPLIATNDALYHAPQRRALQDVVTCIRERTTLEEAGRRLEANAERHLKPPDEMRRLFGSHPQAVAETIRFLERCAFSLAELRRTEYPHESRQGYATPQDALVAYVEEGFKSRYPNGAGEKVRRALDKEIAVTAELNYAPYFLTVHDIVNFARAQGILCQGRGSAANSVICYCLGITEVDPEKVDLLFERFVSAERQEPPDIDVDFEHERREEVIQYIYRRYGRERAGLAATFICYRGRSAIREVGKVFGLSDDIVAALASTLWGWSSSGVSEQDARRAGLDPSDPRLAQVMELARELIGFPRHLSQHVGGFVITRSRLDTVIPIENAAMEDRTVVEWDKNSLEDLGLLKVDILGLGMLSCLRRCFDLMKAHYREKLTLPWFRPYDSSDLAPYAMMSRADTIGVFQIESRAQMSMLPRLRPREFYDLVIEVAIVRPGPIQGNMVHPYLQRRERFRDLGIEPEFPSPSAEYDRHELRSILAKTMGVPLFQEQAMRLAIVAAGFTSEEANKLRRAMATFKRVGTIDKSRKQFIDGMTRRGYDRTFAENCFSQIEGFGEYGFPESHAASFAILVYASAWMKCRYPEVFAAALLNSQPMGFYAPAQIVRDAQDHGVEVRDVDINHSDWDCGLEPGRRAAEHLHPRHAAMRDDVRTTHALRLGLRQVAGFSEQHGRIVESLRGSGFDSVRDLWLRTKLPPAVLERLARADAFRSLGLDRRAALWAVRALQRSGDKDDLPLFARVAMPEREPDIALPPMPIGTHVIEDYRHVGLSLKAHPVAFLRGALSARGILRHEQLGSTPNGARVSVAGLVLVRQRPGTAKGVIFMTLEDETAIANTIVWPPVFERYRPVVLGARLVGVTGKLQSQSGVIHVVADRIDDLTPLLRLLSDDVASVEPRSRADEVKRPSPHDGPRHPRAGDGLVRLLRQNPELADQILASHAAMPKGRNFH